MNMQKLAVKHESRLDPGLDKALDVLAKFGWEMYRSGYDFKSGYRDLAFERGMQPHITGG